MFSLIVVVAQLMLAGASLLGVAFGAFGLFLGIRDGIPWIAVSVVGLVVALAWFRIHANHLVANLDRQVRRVAPGDFRPTVEASAPTEGKYIGISPETGSVVVVDRRKGIAENVPIGKVSRWRFEDDVRGGTYLVLSFDEHPLPTIRVVMPRRAVDDAASRLRMALKF